MIPEPELPAGPVFDRIPGDHKTMPRWHKLDDRSRRRIGKAIADARVYGTFLLYDADVVAVELFGLHPSRVWGEDYWTVDGPLPEMTADELEAMGPA